MIIYGGSAEVSVVKLFIAGFLPGLLLAGMMAAYIYVYARINKLGTPPSRSAFERFSERHATACWHC